MSRLLQPTSGWYDVKAEGTLLTREEKDVVILAAFHPFGQYLSLSYTEIGQRLGISTHRVKMLLHKACVKLKAHNRIEVFFFALLRGEIQLNDIYSLDEIAEILRVTCHEMSSKILCFVRDEKEYMNSLEYDKEIINTDTEDIRQGVILTDSERDVLQLSARGLTNREIAERLSFSVSSVRTFLHRACTKLGACNRTEAVVQALKKGETSIDKIFSLDELLPTFASLGSELLDKVTHLQSQKHKYEPVPASHQ